MINFPPTSEPKRDLRYLNEHLLTPAAVTPGTPSAPVLARILVSDDDPAIRRIYAALLPAHGMEVIEAPGGDGWATLELARKAQPWLLLTDINKPGLDGQRLRLTLRTDEHTAGLPILTVSAIDLHTSNYGPLDDTLVKPFSLALLLYRLTALLPLNALAHDQLTNYALNQASLGATHPATGLPSLHTLADKLPAATAHPDWAAASLSIADFHRQVNLRGRIGAELLLIRMAWTLRSLEPHLLIGHLGFDAQLVMVGPASAIDNAQTSLHAAYASVNALASRIDYRAPLPILRIRYADARIGTQIGVPTLRQALR